MKPWMLPIFALALVSFGIGCGTTEEVVDETTTTETTESDTTEPEMDMAVADEPDTSDEPMEPEDTVAGVVTPEPRQNASYNCSENLEGLFAGRKAEDAIRDVIAYFSEADLNFTMNKVDFRGEENGIPYFTGRISLGGNSDALQYRVEFFAPDGTEITLVRNGCGDLASELDEAIQAASARVAGE